MDNVEYRNMVRAVSSSLVDAFTAQNIAPEDGAKVLEAALSESLAAWLGPIDAIERLRDIADIMERQFLEDTSAE